MFLYIIFLTVYISMVGTKEQCAYEMLYLKRNVGNPDVPMWLRITSNFAKGSLMATQVSHIIQIRTT